VKEEDFVGPFPDIEDGVPPLMDLRHRLVAQFRDPLGRRGGVREAVVFATGG
jgi:hypothetical protein